MDHFVVRILEVWLTASGAAITFFLIAFVLVLCVFFSHRAQEMVREVFSRGMRGRWRDAEIEFGTSTRTAKSDPTGSVSPAQSDNPEPTAPAALPAPATRESPGISNNTDDDEISMTVRMYVAMSNRDISALHSAYDDLKRLPGRQITDEDLATLEASLEYRIDNHTALSKLERIASEQKSW